MQTTFDLPAPAIVAAAAIHVPATIPDARSLRREVLVAQENADLFTADFLEYLPANLHVFEAFEREAKRVRRRGYQHYSARTIIEVLRHETALAEHPKPGREEWKLNNIHVPYLARLFDLLNPEHAGLFSYRATPAAEKEKVAA